MQKNVVPDWNFSKHFRKEWKVRDGPVIAKDIWI